MSGILIAGFFIEKFIYILAIERFMGVFFEKRKTTFSIMALSFLPYFVFSGVHRFSLLTDVYIPHVVVVSFALFIITLNYKSSMMKRAVAVACNYVLFTVLINFSILILSIFPRPPFENELYIWGLIYVLGGILSYLVALLFRRFKSIRKNNVALPKLWISILFVQVLIIVSAFYVPEDSHIFLSFFNFTTLLILFGVNVFAFYLYDTISSTYEDKLKAALHDQEREYYFSQCQLMQESVEQVKAIRHDMKIHLATIKGYTANNKMATDYLNSLLGDIGESENYSDTGNVAFDSIINFKLRNAGHENIKLDIRLLIPSALNIEVADIVTILGNLLDNALDAVEKVEDKQIKLDIELNRGTLFIQLENSFDGVVTYAEKTKGEERCIVTRKSGEEHGYGLKNIRKSVSKYDGQVEISHDSDIFSVVVLLYVDDK